MSIETSEVYVIRSRAESTERWCPRCAAAVTMVSADEAATLIGVSTRTIYRWIEDEKLHFVEIPAKGLLVCLQSLSRVKPE